MTVSGMCILYEERKKEGSPMASSKLASGEKEKRNRRDPFKICLCPLDEDKNHHTLLDELALPPALGAVCPGPALQEGRSQRGLPEGTASIPSSEAGLQVVTHPSKPQQVNL